MERVTGRAAGTGASAEAADPVASGTAAAGE